MGKLFGTDGVRGVANQDITPELAVKLGKAGAYRLTKEIERPTVIIGRDTRISGDMLEAALVAGINSIGADVLKAGVVPTPVLAYLSKELEVEAGIMISASHNPVADNGIKFFDRAGLKLTDQVEQEIEDLIFNSLETLPQPTGLEVGRVDTLNSPASYYQQYLKEEMAIDLCGLRVVMDTANGAAYEVAPRIFKELGAEVITLNDIPDGTNINQNCGSTHPEALQQAVVEQEADLGVAYDGDADRVLAVDEQGNLIDGDLIMAICARYLIDQDNLAKKTIVATKYSNLGLKETLAAVEGRVVTVKNGDRYVLAEMLAKGYQLGGEKSGHIIFSDYNTTGDGIITSLQLIKVMVETGKSLSKLATVMTPFPQILVNVEVANKEEWGDKPKIKESIAQVEEQLGEQGRIFVRASGTEPVIRVMVEGKDEQEIEKLANQTAAVIEEELN
ncbi:phosphoglucosamine mutase [Fuchsiella alkaliacetigena]|uniref:phosphoglucosamine mutase n=1 Tax=Fuchsiella alkaliacetigena TaxID=957042 RepID=UPI00200B5FD4|nr:phosphoglucosamine mutase [Fuchsiella alkaliacetigena]MCK8824150.1 phosphoglucosamine mutase [Fuchsiella alkaliacetigena]